MARKEEEEEQPQIQMETVYWRLPTRIASDNVGDWSALRDHLEQWVTSGEPLEVDTDETASRSLRVPSHVVKALDKEARRLTKLHGKRFTAGSVARLVWDQWEPNTKQG